MTGSGTRCARLGGWLGGVWRLAQRKKKLQGDGLETALHRCLTTADLVLIGLGHMMGAGIYVVTGTVMANNAGASTVLAYAMAGIAAMLGGLCYAQFSVNVPKTGSAYNYVYIIFGEVWGFLAGWNLVLEYLILVAAVGRGLSGYIDALAGGAIHNGTVAAFGDFDSDYFGPVDLLAAGLILVFFIIVAIGVRAAVNVNNAMVPLNVIVILTISISGFAIGSVENFNEAHGGFFPKGVSGTVAATGILFYSYVGFDAIAVAAEETKNPSRSMPIGICVATGIATILYCSASLGLSLLIPYNEINESAPFPDAFKRHGLNWVMYAVSVGALFGIVGSLLGQAFCLPRGIYAIAKDGLLFSPLTYVNSWTQTPLVAVAVSAVLASILAVFVAVEELVQMVSIGTLFAMTLMTVCLIKLHYLPAASFPFQLKIDGVCFFPQESQVNSETTQMTPDKPKGQTLNSIGQLWFDVPYLNRMNADKVTTVVISILTCASIGLSAVLVRGWSLIAQGNWAMVTLLVILLLIFISCFVILLLYEHNVSFAKFSVPLPPWMPVLTMFVNLCLMMVLSSATWIRLIVWIAIGLVLYFAYGIRHSLVDRDNYIEMKDDFPPPPSHNQPLPNMQTASP